jgi:alpha-tubulin suppressor-like RCC1 family protein
MPGPNYNVNGIPFNEYYMPLSYLDQFVVTGSLWLWGRNFGGQLGNNSTIDRSSPVQTVAGGTNWASMGPIKSNSACIKTDGRLWLWGGNLHGNLGNNTAGFDKTSSPVQTVAGGTNWRQITASSFGSSSATKTDGSLWTWGQNSSGQLGDNTTISKSSPIQTIASGFNWSTVSSGSRSIYSIKTDGSLWAWGSNTNGQLGNNAITDVSSPIQTIASGTNWRQVAAGYFFAVATKTDGTLWLWGANSSGQLGDNTTISKSSPIQTIAGGTNWKQVSGGEATCTAIKYDGTLWLWGSNATGQLGDNTTISRSSPVQTVSGGTNWKLVSAGYGFTAAVKTNGTLWTWGNNTNGQLGDNTTIFKSSPIQTINGGSNWKMVNAASSQPYVGEGYIAAIYFYDAYNLYPS